MKRWRASVVFKIGIKAPKRPLEFAFAAFIRHTSREPDDDNLIISFKPVRDGLRDAGVIFDDNRKRLKCRYGWQKTNPGLGHVEVIVSENPIELREGVEWV